MLKKTKAANIKKDTKKESGLLFTKKMNVRIDKLAFEMLETHANNYRIPISTAARRILQDYFYGVKK